MQYYRYHGGKVTPRGIPTFAGYHPGPSNDDYCGRSLCYNAITGALQNPNVVPPDCLHSKQGCYRPVKTGGDSGLQVPPGVNKAAYIALIKAIQQQQAHGVYYPGCSGRLFQLGACPSEAGAAGITPDQVKQALIGAGMILTSAIPVGDILDLLGIGGRAATEGGSLADRAAEIQSSLTGRTARSTTTAVLRAITSSGDSQLIVATSEQYFRAAWLNALKEGEIAVAGPDDAEINALNAARLLRLAPQEIAASRPVCLGCQLTLRNAGVAILSTLKQYALFDWLP